MIAEFKIKNFYSLKDEQTLSFIPTNDKTSEDVYTENVADGIRLLKIGCIYGSNASGKTNILHALDFFSHFMVDTSQKKGDETGVIPFLLNNVSDKEKTEFEMTFYLMQERYKLNLVLDRKIVYKETLQVYTSPQPTLLYDRVYNADTDSTEIKFGSKAGLLKKKQDAIEGNTISNRSVIAAFGISNVEKSKLNLVYEMFSNHIAPAMLPTNSLMGFIKRNLRDRKNDKMKKFILHFLKASDFNISDISIHDEEIKINSDMEAFIRNAPSMSDKEKE